MTALVAGETIPVRSHIKAQPATWGRYGVRWTPTVLILDHRGREQHRIEGFLPTEEFLGHVTMGLGYAAAGVKDWDKAEEYFTRVERDYGDTESGPAGLYWAGVARYSASHDAKELRALWEAFQTRYTDTTWAMRSSVWEPKT